MSEAKCKLSIMVPFEGMTIASLKMMILLAERNNLDDNTPVLEDRDPDGLAPLGIEIIAWGGGR